MNAQSLELLLDQLADGNVEAAEALFATYEPHLRMVVRRQLSHALRAKFDSVDIVQSVWADLLVGFRRNQWDFRDPAHLKAFLVRATRNRFIDRIRKCQRQLEHEHPLPAEEIGAAVLDRPSQIVQADELWDQILDVCPEKHREILELKRNGASLDEIAQRTGLHKSSVRRILYEIAKRLADQRSASPDTQ